MVEGESRTAGRGSSGGVRRHVVADLLLLALAVAVLAVPSWIRRAGGDALEIEMRTLQPVTIEVNSAPWYEWALLEGIGEARARRIVEYRRQLRAFRQLDELRDVPGMPRGWLERSLGRLRLVAPASTGAPETLR